jgi:Flp pilus assembly protein TadB
LKRRTFDIGVPIVYALAVLVAILLGDAAGVGGVAVIGAFCLVVYYAQVRQNLKA